MLDQAFEALKNYDYGVDRHVLDPIDEAVVTTRDNPAARKDLESKLLAVLQGNAPRDARDYVCRVLRTIGTAASVPPLEALLADPELSHMARYALERIPDAKAGQALERQLRKVSGPLKIGVISSLGTRREGVSLLRPLLQDPDEAIARAAAKALGSIASADASKTLASAKARPALDAVFADAAMACAEQLFAAGHAKEAKAVYQRLLKGNPAPVIHAAAERGLKACEAA
jgi:HEAT repeat protein